MPNFFCKEHNEPSPNFRSCFPLRVMIDLVSACSFPLVCIHCFALPTKTITITLNSTSIYRIRLKL